MEWKQKVRSVFIGGMIFHCKFRKKNWVESLIGNNRITLVKCILLHIVIASYLRFVVQCGMRSFDKWMHDMEIHCLESYKLLLTESKENVLVCTLCYQAESTRLPPIFISFPFCMCLYICTSNKCV